MVLPMDIVAFTKKYVEGYLFCDLKHMAEYELPKEEKYGAISYPMIATIIGGMELLGTILFDEQLPPDYGFGSGDDTPAKCYFYFWEKYFIVENPKYNEITKLSKMIKRLLRNGIDHHFIAHPGLTVTKVGELNNLRVTEDGQVNLDAKALYNDFHRTYKDRVENILISPRTKEEQECQQRAQNRLNELMDAKKKQLTEFLPYIEEYINKLKQTANTTTHVFPDTPATSTGTYTITFPPKPIDSLPLTSVS